MSAHTPDVPAPILTTPPAPVSPSQRLLQFFARVTAISSAVALGQVFAGERDVRTIAARAGAAGVVSEVASRAIATAQEFSSGEEPSYAWTLASYGWKHSEAPLYAAGYLLDTEVDGVDQVAFRNMLAGLPPPPR